MWWWWQWCDTLLVAAGSSLGRVLILGVASLFLYYYFRIHLDRTFNHAKTTARKLEIVPCPNPNCVRCRRYKQVQRTAIARLPWILKELKGKEDGTTPSFDRLIDSIQNPQDYITNSYQRPNVLMVKDLPSREVVTEDHEPNLREILSQPGLAEAILLEAHRAPHLLWAVNDTPEGHWEVLSLVNQGAWNKAIAEACPKLAAFTRRVPGRMEDCLFGNVMISKVYEGTTIAPHCGPTNIRHRLQLALHVPPIQHPEMDTSPREHTANISRESTFTHWWQRFHRLFTEPRSPSADLSLSVGRGVQLEWKQSGNWFVFDDSFIHAVRYLKRREPGTKLDGGASSTASEDNYRIVLIIDLWHPLLTQDERDLIRHLYPQPSTTRYA